jgi:hypothetical protein
MCFAEADTVKTTGEDTGYCLYLPSTNFDSLGTGACFDAPARRCDMAAILMKTDEYDIGHEALLLKECREEVMYEWRNPQTEQASDKKRTSALKIVLSPALVEVGDKVSFFRSTDLPPCP